MSCLCRKSMPVATLNKRGAHTGRRAPANGTLVVSAIECRCVVNRGSVSGGEPSRFGFPATFGARVIAQTIEQPCRAKADPRHAYACVRVHLSLATGECRRVSEREYISATCACPRQGAARHWSAWAMSTSANTSTRPSAARCPPPKDWPRQTWRSGHTQPRSHAHKYISQEDQGQDKL